MYAAEVVLPPSFSRAGVDDFSTYRTAGASNPDVRDVLNWEWIGEDKTFWGDSAYMFWAVHTTGSQASLLDNVKNDVYWYNVPVFMDVLTYYSSGGTTYRLPNWSKQVEHAIAIIGWNDTTQKFTYIDTCSRDCNSSSGNNNGGTYTVSYSTMFTLLSKAGNGYVY